MDAVQVRNMGANYGCSVPPPAEMLHWLATAARELREQQGRKMIGVAASLNASESTVWRFEHEKGWPEKPDAMIAAYADDLDVPPLAIWLRAVALWSAATPRAIGSDRAGQARAAQQLEDLARSALGEQLSQTTRGTGARRGSER
jgi:hypothetical protein